MPPPSWQTACTLGTAAGAALGAAAALACSTRRAASNLPSAGSAAGSAAGGRAAGSTGSAAGPSAAAAAAAAAPAAAAAAGVALEVWELKGEYYQVLGHAWDHEVKDFKVVYRPLYHCPASAGRFEAHALATSHFSRWESKFNRMDPATLMADLPPAAAALLLRGPFVHDPQWELSSAATPTGAPPGATRSGFGSRSHEPPLLTHLIGDYPGFIDGLISALTGLGLDPAASRYELDHICYRCSSVAQYRALCGALMPAFGTLAVEGMIGGRPIATVRLHTPIEHAGFTVSCIEVPCPKPGRFYAAGLEHAEFVIGERNDGFGNTALIRWAERVAKPLGLNLDERALQKDVNADLSLSLPALHGGGATSVKFHQRPLYEVVAYEIESGTVVPVPEGYFEEALAAEQEQQEQQEKTVDVGVSDSEVRTS